MSIIKSNGAGESGGFYNGVVSTSLRFDGAGSTKVARTPSEASNQRTFTLSMWIKRGNILDQNGFFDVAASGTTKTSLNFHSDDGLRLWVQAGNGAMYTSQLFRDCAGWFNLILQANTSTPFVKYFINGTETTAFTYDNRTTYPSTNNMEVNSEIEHLFGGWYGNGSYTEFSGYLAEINFVDGASLAPSSFGESKDGVWIPINTSGLTFGTNGYRLSFASTDLNISGGAVSDPRGSGTNLPNNGMADASGGGNHFTCTGITARNIVPDCPENNFPTFNFNDLNHRAELAEGNLKLQATTYSTSGTGGGNYGFATGSISLPSSGKFYVEALHRKHAGAGNISSLGVINRNQADTTGNVGNYFQGDASGGEGFDGIQISTGSGDDSYFVSRNDGNEEYRAAGQDDETNHISALAIDIDNGYVYIGFNAGTDNTGSEITWRDFASNDTGSSNVNPTSAGSGTGGIARAFSLNDVIISDVATNGGNSNKSSVTINFGQDSSFAGVTTAQGETDANGIGDFYYTVPSGYLALCTSNLPDLTIGPDSTTQASDHFQTLIYDGSDAATRTFDVGFVSDFSWFKARNAANIGHQLYDSSRGATKFLAANTSGAESTNSEGVTSFNSSGLLAIGNSNFLNKSGRTHVLWNWKANGGTTTTNDASATSVGATDSVFQANTDAGFSIVTYTGTGSATTFAHGLGGVPEVMIIKNRTGGDHSWAGFYHHLMAGSAAASATDYLSLNGTSAVVDDATIWNDTPPTSTVFSVGTAANTGASKDYVGYFFRGIEGYSKFGSWIGNGQAAGTFVYLGFRPAWVLLKTATLGSQYWNIFDSKRDPENDQASNALFTNDVSAVEAVGDIDIDLLSNGMKMRDNGNNHNSSGHTYIYLAFAEAPFKFANAR